MRFDIWLRAASANLGTPSRASSTQDSPLLPASTTTAALPAATVITFNEISSGTFAPRVFQAGESDESSLREIGWTKVDDEATIVDVTWVGMESRSSDFGDFGTIVVAEASDDKFDVNAPFHTVEESSATLDFNEVDDKYLKFPMAIRVDWESNSMSGYTQSSVFAVVKAGEETGTDVSDLNNFIVSMDSSSGTQTASVGSPTAGTHPSGISPDVPSATTTESSSDDSDSDSSGGGGGGLSTGAIAGIAVGAGVVVIAAIAALVWFFLRRRRQNKMHAGYAAQETSNSFMVDKDSSHQAVAEDSPRSPYSDDGHIHQAAPYDDAAAPAARDVSPAGNQDVSRSVAHLVEDGMTQDEIRRLEEEERQLDAEIERAGRR